MRRDGSEEAEVRICRFTVLHLICIESQPCLNSWFPCHERLQKMCLTAVIVGAVCGSVCVYLCVCMHTDIGRDVVLEHIIFSLENLRKTPMTHNDTPFELQLLHEQIPFPCDS